MNNKYSGMTVNERLFNANLLSAFDTAAKKRDRKKMIEILVKVEFTDPQAQETTDTILKNPSMYNY
jgi:hypothetical protein